MTNTTNESVNWPFKWADGKLEVTPSIATSNGRALYYTTPLPSDVALIEEAMRQRFGTGQIITGRFTHADEHNNVDYDFAGSGYISS